MGLRPLIGILTDKYGSKAGEIMETLGGADEVLKLHATYDGLGANEEHFLSAVAKRLELQQDAESHKRRKVDSHKRRKVDIQPERNTEEALSPFSSLKANLVEVGVKVDDDVLDRAISVYGERMWKWSTDRAVATYRQAESLPSKQTRTILRQKNGLILDGAFYHQPSRATLFVCLDSSGVPHILKFSSDQEALIEEFSKHSALHDLPGVLGPVRLLNFGKRSRVVDKNDLVVAEVGILLPMMASSLDAYEQPLPEAIVVRNAPLVISGLAAMHNMGYKHNDLQPSNLFVAYDGTWRIGDFGSTTFGTAQPTETTDAMWPGELESSERTDNIMMAHTLLLICGKVEWGKATLENLRSSAATSTQALREILESLLV